MAPSYHPPWHGKRPFYLRHRTFLFTLIALFLFAAFFFLLLVAAKWPSLLPAQPDGTTDSAPPSSHLPLPFPWQYTIVVDAGSSGSRLLVYKNKRITTASAFVQDASQKVLPMLLNRLTASSSGAMEKREGHEDFPEFIKVGDEITDGDDTCAEKINPGISEFDTRPLSEIPAYMNKLLCRAKQIVPAEQHASTPFYLLATAGMRLLSSAKQAAIHGEICRHVQQSTRFSIQSCAEQVLTISGEKEGLYGWFAVNYLKKTLANPSATFGFLDMGGASAQVAYVPDAKGIRDHLEDLESVTLKKRNGETLTYPIFTKTFLGFGANQAYQQHEAFVKSAGLNDSCSPAGLYLADSASGPIVGDGNLTQCLKRTEQLINKQAICPSRPCLFNGIHYPGINFAHSAFIGVSEYWYTAKDIFDLGGRYNAQDWLASMTGFCTASWQDIQQEFHYGNGTSPWLKGKHAKWTAMQVSEERLKTQCFKSAWIYSLLHDGFEFPKEPSAVPMALPTLQSMDNVDGQPISWALGAVLMLTCGLSDGSNSGNALPFSSRLFLYVLVLLCVLYAVILLLRKGGGDSYRHLDGRLPLTAFEAFEMTGEEEDSDMEDRRSAKRGPRHHYHHHHHYHHPSTANLHHSAEDLEWAGGQHVPLSSTPTAIAGRSIQPPSLSHSPQLFGPPETKEPPPPFTSHASLPPAPSRQSSATHVQSGAQQHRLVSPTFTRPFQNVTHLGMERPESTPAELTQRASRAFSGGSELEPSRSSSAFQPKKSSSTPWRQ